MTFDERQKVIIETLNIDEARAFIKFLKSEIIRHQRDIEDAWDLRKTVKEMYNL